VTNGGIEVLNKRRICQMISLASSHKGIIRNARELSEQLRKVFIFSEGKSERETARKTNKMTRVEQQICHYFDQKNDFEFFHNESDHEKEEVLDDCEDCIDVEAVADRLAPLRPPMEVSENWNHLKYEERRHEMENEMWQMLASLEI